MHMKTSKVLALALALLLVLGCCSVALADGQYTITYAIYGQVGVYTTQTVTEGDPLGTLPAGPTVAGKVFVRWFRMDGSTRVRRISRRGTNLGRIAQVNEVSRRVEHEQMSAQEAALELEKGETAAVVVDDYGTYIIRRIALSDEDFESKYSTVESALISEAYAAYLDSFIPSITVNEEELAKYDITTAKSLLITN